MSAVVHLGDCLEVMKTFPDNYFSAVITDPPYGTTDLAFDQIAIDWPAWWAEVHRVTKEAGVIVCFAADLFTVDLIQSNRKHYRYRLVWKKTRCTGFLDANRRPMRGHEDILVFAQRYKGSTYNVQMRSADNPPEKTVRVSPPRKDSTHWGESADPMVWTDDGIRHPSTVLKFSNGRPQDSLHPTQKPLDLMEWLVRTYTNPGDRVLDPFCGSGSTGAACVKLGREFVGVEIDATFHATAVRRVANAQPALLGVS